MALTFWTPRTTDRIPILTRSVRLTLFALAAQICIGANDEVRQKDLGEDAFLPLPPREILEAGQVGRPNQSRVESTKR